MLTVHIESQDICTDTQPQHWEAAQRAQLRLANTRDTIVQYPTGVKEDSMRGRGRASALCRTSQFEIAFIESDARIRAAPQDLHNKGVKYLQQSWRLVM